jgi:hypothetical protein
VQNRPKQLDTVIRPRFKAVSVIVHGRFALVFLVPPDQVHGANMTTTIIQHTLQLIAERDPDFKIKKLWVQLDNPTGENKNTVVHGYIANLVHQGVIEEGEVCHLIPGHTHEDIDNFHAIHSALLKSKLGVLFIFPSVNNYCICACYTSGSARNTVC